MNKNSILCAAALALLGASAAQAQSAGSFVVRAGGTTIMPQVESGDLSAPSLAGTKIDVKKASQFTGGITWMWTDNIAIDLPLGLPFEHDVVGDGAIAGVGVLGTVKSLPMTLLAQYRFGQASSQIRPYVGAGATYAYFYDSEGTAVLSGLTGGSPSKPTTLSMKNAFGPALQAGLSVNLTERWSLDASVMKVFVKTTGTLSTGQTIDATLDPVAVSIAVGYRF
ncbi:OmpW/AlkL family protein [Roseateles violae]|uniref:OmpW family outer membrane protein n=1 Tax=Roseateles violae TaxID=3058042 RepID=A0ABT8DMP2_9BURK|nr:OmpW family outer membrane protein [Pelomonas sp. PFR6]MDN3919203.1 OmpW family outer membrane protein [Pelomonas sp. PFR6]